MMLTKTTKALLLLLSPRINALSLPLSPHLSGGVGNRITTSTPQILKHHLPHSLHHRITPSHFQSQSQSYSQSSHSTSTTLNALLPISLPIIQQHDTWGNIATICATASISHGIGRATSIGRLLGPPVTAMAIAFLLGSIGFLPAGGSAGTKSLQLLSIQLATPLLLMGVNIRECRKRCGPLLIAFITASIGTILAASVAYPICSPLLINALGIDGLKIAAALMAKNVGGGLNYIAVCRSLNASNNAIAAGLCVDNIFALLYFPITSALASGKPDPSELKEKDVEMKKGTNDNKTAEIDHNDNSINAETMSAAFAISAVITWFGEKLGGQAAALPLATLMTILFTLVFPSTAMSLSLTGEALGTSLLYIFFATAGAPGLSIADSVKASFLPVGLFLTLLYGIHGLVLVTVRKLVLFWHRRKQEINHEAKEESSDSFVLPSRLLVASSAAIGGPATAAALAKANKWNSLVAPSLIVGNLGYAMATFAGIAFYKFFL